MLGKDETFCRDCFPDEQTHSRENYGSSNKDNTKEDTGEGSSLINGIFKILIVCAILFAIYLYLDFSGLILYIAIF